MNSPWRSIGLGRGGLGEDGFTMAQIKSWTVSDDLWSKVEPLIPVRSRQPGREYQRKAGAGRKPISPRVVFAAIVFVLRTGIQWKALPREFGSSSAVHQHFQNWYKAGFFLKLWQAGLAEYDGMHGIAWQWQSADGAMGRGKKRAQTQPVGRRPWSPAVDYRQRRQPSRLQAAGSDPRPGSHPAS